MGPGAALLVWQKDKAAAETVITAWLAALIGCGLGALIVRTKLMFWIFGLLPGIFITPEQAAHNQHVGMAEVIAFLLPDEHP